MRLKRIISWLLGSFGYEIRNKVGLDNLDRQSRFGVLLKLLVTGSKTSNLNLEESIEIVSKSQSQLGQDILALSLVGKGKSGFFVEFGATDGKTLSNTYLLEKEFGWSGILCEPGRAWHTALKNNRVAAIDTRCVFSASGSLVGFTETSVGELSTISSFMRSDGNRFLRKNMATYQVETISLQDLLSAHNAPKYIEFLSVDTEGSEYDILKGFPFEEYSFGLICVEHNFTSNREKIHELLSDKGYERVLTEYSAFDDWYLGSRS